MSSPRAPLPPPGPFDELVAGLLARCFAHQNTDGGLPETFPGQPSGCWTSAEIYAAIACMGLERLAPPEDVDRLERWLVGACERHGGRGVPYYEVGDASGEPTSKPVVEATACLLLGLDARGRRRDLAASMATWLATAQLPSGGWGISTGEAERVYSTAYAVDALAERAPEAAARGRARLRELALDLGATRAWPFRPGIATPSALMTHLAAGVLRAGLTEPEAAAVRRHLLTSAEAPALIEEDEFPTRDGLSVSFAYAPRLVALGGALALFPASPGSPVDRADLDRALRALALAEHALARAGRPAPELPDERMWHYIDFAWGYGGVAAGLAALGEEAARRYVDHADIVRRDLARRHLVARAPEPVASVARALWQDAETASDRLPLHLALVETVARVLRARMASALLAAGRAGPVRREAARPRPGASRSLWGLWRALTAAARAGGPEAAALVEAMAPVRPALQRWIRLRNTVAHGLPADATERRRLADAWDDLALEALGPLAALTEPPWVTVEEVGLPVGTEGFLYRARAWRGEEGPRDERLVPSAARLADRLYAERPDPGAATPVQLAVVYAGAFDGGADALRPVSPFAVRAPCASCRGHHLFLLEGAATASDVAPADDALDLAFVAPRCGGRFVARWPWPAGGPPVR